MPSIAGLSIGWEWIIGGVPALLLVYWFLDEWGDADDGADAIERVGERSRGLTAGLFSGMSSLVFSLLLVGVTLGDQLIRFLDQLLMVVAMDPMASGILGVGVLGSLGLSGVWDVGPVAYLGIAAGVLVLAVLWRRRGTARRSRR